MFSVDDSSGPELSTLPYTTLFRSGGDHRAEVDDAAARRAEELQRLLRDQQQAQDVEVELLVEMLRRDLLQRSELVDRSEEHTSELQSRFDLVCRLLLEKKNTTHTL